ncbi:MAG TPA: hypothetical protein PK264_18155, partial [Hyphomicrobiaceae bacterium]|nr:hypothetical protein [Hyphomicrobiaceae bacterium]
MPNRKITITVNAASYRRWQGWVIDALRADRRLDVDVVLEAAAGHDVPSSVETLLTLERMLYGRVSDHAFDRIDARETQSSSVVPRETSGPAGLALDLTLGPGREGSTSPLKPLIDGDPCIGALITALLDHRLPELSLADGAGRAIPIGLVAVEEPRVLSKALDSVLCRLAATLPAIVARLALGEDDVSRAPSGAPPARRVRRSHAPHAASFAISSLAAKVRDRLARILGTAPQWQLAWRKLGADNTSRLPSEIISRRDYRILPDDGRRYFGDPFGIVHDGVTHVFCEELPFATMKGVISAFTLDADGTPGPVKVVLERPNHLSYPQLFVRDGHIWMMPETTGSNGLELYRATRYPDQWELVARPMEGQFHDATLYDEGRRLWIFASISDRRASTWDTLAIFSAERLEGVFDVVQALGCEGAPDAYTDWLDAEIQATPDDEDASASRLLQEAYHPTTWVGNEAVRLARSLPEPFFLWASLPRPRWPLDPPVPWKHMYRPSRLQLPEGTALMPENGDCAVADPRDAQGHSQA